LTKTSRYAAVLAKIGAERGKLLNEPKLRMLAESKNLGEFTIRLRESSYSEELNKVKVPVDVRKIEHALKDNLLDSFDKIVSNSPKNTQPFLRTHLQVYEVQNLKALIKATAAGMTTEEKLAKMHLLAEVHLGNMAVFESAANAENLKELLKAFARTDYIDVLDLGLNRYDDTKSTRSFDVLLDRSFYERVHAALQKLPKAEQKRVFFYASLQTDGFTLLSLLRGKLLGDESEWLRTAIPHDEFELSQKTVEALTSAEDFESALKIAQRTRLKDYFQKVVSSEETIAGAERALEKAVLKHACEFRFRDVFNVGALVAFMVQKEAEVGNLVTISLGIDNKQKPEDIWRLLLLPD
jgi:V/A-type H+/Na+-transporting ATPase subunit C